MEEPEDLDAHSLAVEVMAVRWKAPDDDFAILEAVTDEGETVVITGPLGHVQPGEAAEVSGGWSRHPKHGWRFMVRALRIAEPVSDEAVVAYLTAVKHVGRAGARWLVDKHGSEVLSVIDADPAARLHEVPGIGRARLNAAVKSWQTIGEQRAVRLFLESHGVPAAVAARVYRALGGGAIEMLQADPYALTELDGIGFATADALAQALGVPPDSPGRLDAGVVHALNEAEMDGHCYLPRAELEARASRMLGADASDRIDALVLAGRVVVEEDRVAESVMAAVERQLARNARVLIDAEPAWTIADPERPLTGPFVPTDDQWAVVDNVLGSRLSILTGGPGTGKTASMQTVVDLLRANRRTPRLCAPTGKAARRLAETTGAEATTIHRLLEWIPGEGFTRDHENPIEATDLLIVDEASMLSVRLAAALFDAIGPRTHVLLVGDVDQLAPVGPGRVLEDMIDSGAVPTVRLTAIFRQAARSMIVRAAHAINAGEAPPTTPQDGDIHDFFLVARDGAQAIFDEVCDLASRRLPAHYGLEDAGDAQVLAPMHKGPVGIDAFNTELRARLNPTGEPIGGTPFRLGDRVLQTRNNHELELMNGELGVIVAYDTDASSVLLACDDGRRIRVPLKDTDTLRLAHAISVHKAQGSQMPVVIVPLFRGHHVMLTRNLIYTALTRAEQAADFVGDPSALQIALGRRDAHTRNTRLAQLLLTP